MNLKLLIALIFNFIIKQLAAQQNWIAPLPCYNPVFETIDKMFVDSLHNEIILNSNAGFKACNVTYKGVFAYDGSNFHDLDLGLDVFTTNQSTGGTKTMASITYGNKTLFGGAFYSVGSDTLYSKSIALWNGNVWDTFPKRCFSNKVNGSGGSIWGFLKNGGQLWMYGAFDTIGGIVAKNICSFDGNTFTSRSIPVPDAFNYNVRKIIEFKNKLIAIGDFYNSTFTISRVAIYDGTNWASLGNGIKGSLSFIHDMIVFRDTLYIAGTWPQSSGNPSNYIMKWDGSQLRDAGFGSQYSVSNTINQLLVYRDRLYAFGGFTHAANQKAYGVAYYQDGKWTVPQDSIGNYGIRYAVVYNDAIYVAGAFKGINNDTTIKNFAKLRCPDFDAANSCLSGVKENLRYSLEINVFPNPSNTILMIECGSVTAANITIVNSLGQIVLQKNTIEIKQELDVSHLKPGLYFLEVEAGLKKGRIKFLKE